MLTTIHERVKRSVAAGRSLEQFKAERPAKEWDESLPRSFVTSDHVVEEAYRAVTSRKQRSGQLRRRAPDSTLRPLCQPDMPGTELAWRLRERLSNGPAPAAL